MTIEFHQPELEAFILERMEICGFNDVEEFLLYVLKSAPLPEPSRPHVLVRGVERKVNFAQLLLDSPLASSGLEIKRNRDSRDRS